MDDNWKPIIYLLCYFFDDDVMSILGHQKKQEKGRERIGLPTNVPFLGHTCTCSFNLPRVPNIKIKEKSQILFCTILKNKWYHIKVPLKKFHLNGHTIGFCPLTQKLELHYMSPYWIWEVNLSNPRANSEDL